MRDRWVLVYLILVFLQLPLYYKLGREELGFDFAVKDVEKRLRGPLLNEDDKAAIEASLNESEQHLEQLGPSSREGRIELNRGVFAWKRGKSKEAIEHLERSREIFVQYHGPDAFHAAAVDLRLGELLFLQGKILKAEERFGRSRTRVNEYMGEHTRFAVRMAFRHVSCLAVLGRHTEAAELAARYTGDLRVFAPELDEQFLQRTGSTLDSLSLVAEFPGPGQGMNSWKTLLISLKRGVAKPTLEQTPSPTPHKS